MGRHRWRVLDAAHGARWRGRRERHHRRRRAAGCPPTRCLPPDDGLAGRRCPPEERAGRRAARIRGCDLSAVRVRAVIDRRRRSRSMSGARRSASRSTSGRRRGSASSTSTRRPRCSPGSTTGCGPTIPGALSREPERWRLWLVGDAEWMRQRDGIKFNALLEVDGQARGFAIYRIKQSWEMTGPDSTLNVLEVTGLDPAAEQALWEWLFSIDLVTTVAGRRGPSPHPLQHWLLEPRRLALTINDGTWLRILDVPAALAARRYVGSGSLVLDVADEGIDTNAGRWRLTVEGGAAQVSRTKAAADLELDIAALAAAYLGGFRFADLAVAGQVRSRKRGALQTADALFTPPRAPWNSTPF